MLTKKKGNTPFGRTNCLMVALVCLLVLAQISITIKATQSNNATISKTEAPALAPSTTITTTTTTTTTIPTTATPAATTTPGPLEATTPIPYTKNFSIGEKELAEVKKIIKEHIDLNHSEKRLAMNKPTTSLSIMSDFAPESLEARVADATTRFGLNFINNLPSDSIKSNVVISPISLQCLLNMILLGSSDNSTSQQELVKVLGYNSSSELALLGSQADRLRPHEAMRSVFSSILTATHLSVSQHMDLLNANSGSFQQQQHQHANEDKPLVAHLQTSFNESDTPLSGQLNFTLANLVFTNKDMIELKPDYEKELKSFYNVNVEQFSKVKSPKDDADGGSKPSSKPLHERVNDWVKNMTQNQIEKLAEESDLSSEDLIMVLLNAAHFKGRWLHTFNTKATHERTFFNQGLEKEATNAKFMRQKGVFGYADFGIISLQNEMGLMQSSPDGGRTRLSAEDSETLLTEDNGGNNGSLAAGKHASSESSANKSSAPTIELSKEETRRMELTSKLNCSVLMLPFSLNEGQELSMVILLPAKRDGLKELQASLDGPTLNEIYKSLSEQQVQVELPKFSFDSSHDAKATLIRMGLNSIFDDSANLSRMYVNKGANGKGPAKVDKVIHKAKINVDETGAEAAAASMASIVLRNFIRPPTPLFVADHPFLFIIRHNRSNMPLFMGQVSSL